MFLSLAAPFLAYIAGRVARPGEPAPAGPHRGQIFTTAASYPISFAYRIRVVSFGALPAGLIRAARAIVVGAEAVTRPKPVEQPTRFYLSIYRYTVGELGLPIPLGLLAQADDVVE